MSRTVSPAVAHRRTRVRQILEEEPQLSARAIADRLGVGKDTVLRDMRAIRQTAPDADQLVIVLDESLRQALAVLRGTRGRPDNHRENEAATRAAIRAMADIVLEGRQRTQNCPNSVRTRPQFADG
ncbi:HTH domain-containing protein [Streptomyces sp. CA-106110]|uniref:HTH domain-containing protein n=1 Tax=Streptomyces sp. CA-106110 TaxID=3240044 RepID=UPI003D8E4631